MGVYLGIDTSNYMTSVALYDSDTHEIRMKKHLLPVQEGALGLKQSDAVFHHIRQFPILMEQLTDGKKTEIAAVGVSAFPRRQENSYMPCFLAGKMAAATAAALFGVPQYAFSHQEGHIMAALYSVDRLDLLNHSFYAFHVSGGTTECLMVEYQENGRFKAEPISVSLDLKAGQAIDRAGVMLGLPFPAGKYLDELSCRCAEKIKAKAVLKGTDASFSGVENQCKKLFSEGKSKEYIAKYCITFVKETICAMSEAVLKKYGEKPLLYAGGVMSNSMMRKELAARFGGLFAEPVYSSDNSAGIAVLAALADGKEIAECRKK